MTFIARSLLNVATLVVAIVVLVALWFWWPEAINATLDFNIMAIKFLSGMLPDEYAARTETAVRALNTERGLLVGEAMVLITMVRHLLFKN